MPLDWPGSDAYPKTRVRRARAVKLRIISVLAAFFAGGLLGLVLLNVSVPVQRQALSPAPALGPSVTPLSSSPTPFDSGKVLPNTVQHQAQSSAPALVSPVTQSPIPTGLQGDSGKVLKLYMRLLVLKYSTNPFEFRRKAIGKYVETEIYQDKFIDEGTNARIIDLDSAFLCVMDGLEFGRHNKRTLIIVRGRLSESEGMIGLNGSSLFQMGELASTSPAMR